MKTANKRKLTGETNGTDVSDVNQRPMTEACSTIVHLDPRWQRQLGPRSSVRQIYPLHSCRRGKQSQKIFAEPTTRLLQL